VDAAVPESVEAGVTADVNVAVLEGVSAAVCEGVDAAVPGAVAVLESDASAERVCEEAAEVEGDAEGVAVSKGVVEADEPAALEEEAVPVELGANEGELVKLGAEEGVPVCEELGVVV